MNPFSDRARVWVLPVLGLLLLGDVAAWTGVRLTSGTSYERCLDPPRGATEPSACVGEQLVLPLQRVIAIDGPERYRIGRVDGRIVVHGSSEGLRVGQEISVGGLRTEQGLQAEWMQTHPLRPWKRRLGQLGVLVLIGLGLAAFTVRRTESGWRVVPRGGPRG